MIKIPKISEAEWVVMKVIWFKNPITANRIVERLSGVTTWNPNTIKTLINRLAKKGAIGYETKGREYHYYPLIEEGVFVKEDYAYAIMGASSMHVIDVSNPANPQFVADYATERQAIDMFVEGQYIYLFDSDYELGNIHILWFVH